MGFKDVADIIQFAIDKEQEAADFYLDASRQEAIRGVKELFEAYSKEEAKHRNLLEDLKKNKEKVADFVPGKIQDLKRSDFLVDTPYRPGMGYVEIIRLAMKREEKAYKLYSVLERSTKNEKQAQIFRMLAAEEGKHKNELETIYDDFMAKQGD